MTHDPVLPSDANNPPPSPEPGASEIARWKLYLADERAEAAVYRDLANRRTGEEREILLALAEAEGRHAAHWEALLGAHAETVTKPRLRSRVLGFLTRRFGSVFVLALAQRAEARSPYGHDQDATQSMAADERIHEEVVRGLAARGRNRLSGSFRAAVFGANDGLVSNLALILGVGATGVPTGAVLIAGLAGLLAGALSMGAGEYVSVRSQRELLEASSPNHETRTAYPYLDVNANELALVYRARGMSEEDATAKANTVLRGREAELGGTDSPGADWAGHGSGSADSRSADWASRGSVDADALGRDQPGVYPRGADPTGDDQRGAGRAGADRASAGRAGADPAGADQAGADPASAGRAGADRAGDDDGSADPEASAADPEASAADPEASAGDPEASAADQHEAIGTAFNAAMASFWFFASGAVIPVLPYLFGMEGIAAQLVATGLVGVALVVTGAVVGLLSGGPPLKRALRQLAIGFGAAAVTWLLGLVLGQTIS